MRGNGRRGRARSLSADTADLARQLTSRLGLEVGVRERGKGGVLTIRWRDETQLEYLLKRLE